MTIFWGWLLVSLISGGCPAPTYTLTFASLTPHHPARHPIAPSLHRRKPSRNMFRLPNQRRSLRLVGLYRSAQMGARRKLGDRLVRSRGQHHARAVYQFWHGAVDHGRCEPV